MRDKLPPIPESVQLDAATFAGNPRRNASFHADWCHVYTSRTYDHFRRFRGTVAGRKSPRVNGAMLRLTMQTREQAEADTAAMRAAHEGHIAKHVGHWGQRWASGLRTKHAQATTLTVPAWIYRELDRRLGIDVVGSSLAGGALFAFTKIDIEEGCGWVRRAEAEDATHRSVDDEALVVLRQIVSV